MSTYNIDLAHSHIGFSVRHLMIANVRGSFEKFTGTLHYEPGKPQSARVEMTIEAASVNTREAKRDEDLRGPLFFDAAKFPELIFRSTKIELHRDGSGDGLHVLGDLTLHGVTQPVVLQMQMPSEEIKDRFGKLRVGISGAAKVKRKDFGLVWNGLLEGGGVIVGDDVSIELEAEFVKA